MNFFTIATLVNVLDTLSSVFTIFTNVLGFLSILFSVCTVVIGILSSVFSVCTNVLRAIASFFSKCANNLRPRDPNTLQMVHVPRTRTYASELQMVQSIDLEEEMTFSEQVYALLWTGFKFVIRQITIELVYALVYKALDIFMSNDDSNIYINSQDYEAIEALEVFDVLDYIEEEVYITHKMIM